jgi:hypothetical protein
MSDTIEESERAFWDERFRFFQAKGDGADKAAKRAHEALNARRGHPILPAEEIEGLKQQLETEIRVRDQALERSAQDLERRAQVVREHDRTRTELSRIQQELTKALAQCHGLEVERTSLQRAMGEYREREKASPPQPTETLASAVTVWDIYQAVNEPTGLWRGIRLLLSKWGVDVEKLADSEFWNDTTGIKNPDAIPDYDGDTRRRLRKFLETGLYLKRLPGPTAIAESTVNVAGEIAYRRLDEPS